MSFLISSQRNLERDALSELFYVISDILGYDTQPMKSRVPGLAILKIKDDKKNPLEIIPEIRQYIEEKGPLIACLKVTPLEKLIKTNLDQITKVVFELAKEKISSDQKWGIYLKKRQTNLRSTEVIETVARAIDWGEVNLDNPDFEIRIEIIRDLTGISVMKPRSELRMFDYF